MFECSACALRLIRAIAGDTIPISRSYHRLLLNRLATGRRRISSTIAGTTSGSGEAYLNAAQLRHRDGPSKPETSDQATKRLSAAEERALRKELQYLPDPLKLAEHVQYTLRCEKPDKALELCRMASKEMQCVVSWNHVINWHMQQGKVSEAMKIYNEMKKRAQFPDSYTYLQLLSGLKSQIGISAEVREENALRAVSIYNSMSSPTSRVQPSIMHTNAALRVCSEAHDMDAFWGIASKLPENGPGSADLLTYTIILTAIRHQNQGKAIKELSPEQMDARKLQTVNEGRRVWSEVVAKWRSGEVKIDEKLVCAMARVLLWSPNIHDWDDILNLVQQTTQVERLIVPIGSADRNTGHVPRQAPEDERARLTASAQEDHDGFVEIPAAKVFKPVHTLPPDPNKPKRPTSLAYVTPANDTLSVLIEACTLMRTPKTAVAYWDLFIANHGLQPDLGNFHALLRLLMKNRASGRAAAIIKDHFSSTTGLAPSVNTFRLAMQACSRDRNNRGVLEHARTIVDVLERHCADPDPYVLGAYLNLALSTNDGPQIVSTLNRLDPFVHNIRSRVTYGSDSFSLGPEDSLLEKEELVGFIQNMIGAIDTLMRSGMVPRKDLESWQQRRSQLDAFVGRARMSLRNQRGALEIKRPGKLREREERHVGPRRMALMQAKGVHGTVGATGLDKSTRDLVMFRRRNTPGGSTSYQPRGEPLDAANDGGSGWRKQRPTQPHSVATYKKFHFGRDGNEKTNWTPDRVKE